MQRAKDIAFYVWAYIAIALLFGVLAGDFILFRHSPSWFLAYSSQVPMMFLFVGMFHHALRKHIDALEEQFKPSINETTPTTTAPQADKLVSMNIWGPPAASLLAGVVAVFFKQVRESPVVWGSLYVLVLVPSVFLFCGKLHLALRKRLAALKEQAQPSGTGTTLLSNEMSADGAFSREVLGLWGVSFLASVIAWTLRIVWESPLWFPVYAVVLLPSVFLLLGRRNQAIHKRLEALGGQARYRIVSS